MFVFWIILSLFYLILAIFTFISSRPIKNNLALLSKEGPDSYVTDNKKGKDVSLNENLYRAYRNIIITDIVGFILAASASVISIIL